MKIKSLLTVALACLLTACGSNPKNASTENGLTIVDVETALENLEEELKMSAEFDSVRYVPLETNDSCLIGKNPYNVITDKYILVTYEEADAIYTFDNRTIPSTRSATTNTMVCSTSCANLTNCRSTTRWVVTTDASSCKG